MNINESERNRILTMHETAKKELILKELLMDSGFQFSQNENVTEASNENTQKANAMYTEAGNGGFIGKVLPVFKLEGDNLVNQSSYVGNLTITDVQKVIEKGNQWFTRLNGNLNGRRTYLNFGSNTKGFVGTVDTYRVHTFTLPNYSEKLRNPNK